MGNSYCKLTFFLFYLALGLGLLCRIVLKLRYMEPDTGFYIRPTAWETVQNIVLAASMVLMMAINRLHRADHDYPIPRRSAAADTVGVLAGLAIAVYVCGAYLPAQLGREMQMSGRAGAALLTVFGLLGALSLLMRGLCKKDTAFQGYIAVSACLWQMFSVVTRFNSYATLTTITDNLFIVLFMLFSSVFLIGWARTVNGAGRKDGRNYVIPAGLCMALCGFILVIPACLAVLLRAGESFALPFGCAEGGYIFLLSLYATLFVRDIAKSIRTV